MMFKKVLANKRGDFNLQYAVIVGLSVVALVVVIAIGTLILFHLEAVQDKIKGIPPTLPDPVSCIFRGVVL